MTVDQRSANRRRPGSLCLLILAVTVIAGRVAAAPAWVSDEFEIMLRTGPSTSNAIQMMVSSGTQLEVLERDSASGYSKVRTTGGTEGWVLTRYLMQEPAAREQLARLTRQLTDAASQGSSMSDQLNAIRAKHKQATDQVAALERDKQGLEKQLEEIRRTSANVLAIDAQNKKLQEQLTDAEIRVNTLEQESQELTAQKNRNWFIAGASVLIAGILLGLILPRLRLPRRSRYDSF